MTLTAYAGHRRIGTSPRWVEAFAAGARCKTQILGPLAPGDVALFGHPDLEPLLNEAKDQGRNWYYGDHGFFGRGQFYRCAKNVYQFDGLSGDDDPARFRKFGIAVEDWRRTGSHILLCPNSASFLHRFGAPRWIEDTLTEIRKHTDRHIRIRWKDDKRPFKNDLTDCWAVVTFTSNAGVEAALAGIPVLATRPCAALSMGSADISKIEQPVMPDGREQWAARLANHQWTLREMANGDLWRVLGQ
jgi:hypothetical protein